MTMSGVIAKWTLSEDTKILLYHESRYTNENI